MKVCIFGDDLMSLLLVNEPQSTMSALFYKYTPHHKVGDKLLVENDTAAPLSTNSGELVQECKDSLETVEHVRCMFSMFGAWFSATLHRARFK